MVTYLITGGAIHLTDISEGMLNDAKVHLEEKDNILYSICDCHYIPAREETYDIVIANHVLFYLKDIKLALREIYRVLKPGGYFYCTTYGKNHMKEIEQLVKEFEPRIALSDVNLYDIFGLENGKGILEEQFLDVHRIDYEDNLLVDKEQPLIDYILSCHGNQKDYIHDRYDEFRNFVKHKMDRNGAIRITKMAGMFRCKKT